MTDDPTLGLRRLAIATALGTLLLIAMGGAVRATDSGLACPDWPACYGQWVPPADVNMWFEHSHRLWAGVIALAVTWLTAWSAWRLRSRPVLWRLSLTALVLVLLQAALGAAVVLLQLRAGLVTSHLGMSLVVVACLIVLAVLARPSSEPGTAAEQRIGRWAAVVGVLVFLQALLGSQATGRGAAYVFNAVPIWLADGAWTGHMREWLHVTHRAGGYLVAAAVVAFAVAVRRQRRRSPLPPWTGWLPWLAVALVVLQVGLGLANVLTRAGVFSAVGHLAVASWLWATFVLATVLGLRPGAAGPVAAHRSLRSSREHPTPIDDTGADDPNSMTEEVKT
ncbi:MAG: COX15/CtaA family protein [Nitriliruptoraceae bacterium]